MKTRFITLIAFVVTLNGFSQVVKQNPLSEACFVAQKKSIKNDGIWRTFAVGDKIKFRLKDDKTFRSKISQVTQSSISTTAGTNIDATQIKWIKNTKLRIGNAITGGILTVAGILLFIHVAEGDVAFDEIGAEGGLAVVLTGAGVLILTTHRKFRIDKGDTLTFYPAVASARAGESLPR